MLYNREMKIGLFDSGRGGKSVLESIKKRLPEAEYLYIADSGNCPYGEKTAAELEKIANGNVQKLKDWGAEIIVIACNTMTVKCAEKLRTNYPKIAFVGAEPAIKKACEMGFKNILVLATTATINSARTKDLAAKNQQSKQQVELMACPGLAEVVEENGDVEEALKKLFSKNFPAKMREKIDGVVLGCTHYVLIKNQIQNWFPNAKLIDGNDGIARRVVKIAECSEA